MLKANNVIKDVLNQVNAKVFLLEDEIKKLELKLELERKELFERKEEIRQLEEVVKLITL